MITKLIPIYLPFDYGFYSHSRIHQDSTATSASGYRTGISRPYTINGKSINPPPGTTSTSTLPLSPSPSSTTSTLVTKPTTTTTTTSTTSLTSASTTNGNDALQASAAAAKKLLVTKPIYPSIPNTLSSSVPSTARPTLTHGYVSSPGVPGVGRAVGAEKLELYGKGHVAGVGAGGAGLPKVGSGSGSGSAGGPPALFDFRMTDKSPAGKTAVVQGMTSPTATAFPASAGNGGGKPAGVSLLSQGLRDGPAPMATRSSTSSAPVRDSLLRRTSTSGGKSGLYAPLPPPRMRPRAMSMQMKIKGEILPDGSEDDDEDDEGMAGMDMDEDDVLDAEGNIVEKKAIPLGTGSGGVKGKRKGMVFRCENCSKVYRHPSCLSKHRWEHSPHWASSSKLLLSKHQQVQLLEAATILVHLDPQNPMSTGKSLPEDKSLWPAMVSQPTRSKLVHRTSSASLHKPNFTPYTPSSSLPPQSNQHIRKTSPAGSSSSTESSERAHSVEADSGYSSGPPRKMSDVSAINGMAVPPQNQASSLARQAMTSPSPRSVGNSLPDFSGFHIGSGSPRYQQNTNGYFGSANKASGGYSYASSHSTARANPLFSPSYSPASLQHPQSSVRSGSYLGKPNGLETPDEDDEDDLDEDEVDAGGGFASRMTRDVSMGRESRESPGGDDMDWEANDMEI